jgi:hypothetical protein
VRDSIDADAVTHFLPGDRACAPQSVVTAPREADATSFAYFDSRPRVA